MILEVILLNLKDLVEEISFFITINQQKNKKIWASDRVRSKLKRAASRLLKYEEAYVYFTFSKEVVNTMGWRIKFCFSPASEIQSLIFVRFLAEME